ncbi:GntR family transcriptional regulator [Rubrobacter calidifluminis]|uniref:GntR family transcriptional regulator n=1 Tax=Rubrobacter calidifluminis TaxID=1392640 RepID=UPI002361FDD3|nr:GntR family transcriptional regulator [Rubrobacter calidifluminis]
MKRTDRFGSGGIFGSGGSFGASLPEQVADAVSDWIVEGELEPGSRLPETMLAERFGTSRAPVREAIYLLEQAGLVERVPRKGTVVRDHDEGEVREIYRVRFALEEFALERICGTEQERRRAVEVLSGLLERMREARDDPRHYHDLNFAFHKALIQASGSELLDRLYRQIEGPLRVFLRLSFLDPEVVAASTRDHAELVEAIRAGDLERASGILREHDARGMKRAIAHLYSKKARSTHSPKASKGY